MSLIVDLDLLALLPPARIRVRFPFTGGFHRAEAEHAAAWVAFFAREHTPLAWEPIPVAQLVEWLKECALDPELRPYLSNPFIDLARGFRMLKERGYVRGEDRLEVTEEFVLRCFLTGHYLTVPLKWTVRAMAATPAFIDAWLNRSDNA